MDLANFVLTFGPAGLVVYSLGKRLIMAGSYQARRRRPAVEREDESRRTLPTHRWYRVGRGAPRVMSHAVGGMERKEREPVYIPVSNTSMAAAGMAHATTAAPDIDAVSPQDRDITRESWMIKLAVARDADKKYMFSANGIFALVGGDRNTVLATIREIRSGVPPAAFRQDDGGTAPASYPVTKKVNSA